MNLSALDPSILARLAWAIAIIAGGLLLYQAFNRLALARLRARRPALTGRRGLPTLLRPGVPVLVYFTTPTCAPCKTVQRPAIQRVQAQVGERLQVIEIDAARQPEVAGEWGVMSVPTTFVLDSGLAARYVNHGVTPADKLLRQLNDVL
ncbi:MAG: thioredoxin family protein [Chloroflexota bacterium]